MENFSTFFLRAFRNRHRHLEAFFISHVCSYVQTYKTSSFERSVAQLANAMAHSTAQNMKVRHIFSPLQTVHIIQTVFFRVVGHRYFNLLFRIVYSSSFAVIYSLPQIIF
uniref:Uncharacterized protein n=1 Tax=Parascaris univalens TaxID=6257 RepID=A0A915B7G4_PARUN